MGTLQYFAKLAEQCTENVKLEGWLSVITIPHKLMCLGELKATHWAIWPSGSGHYPLNLP